MFYPLAGQDYTNVDVSVFLATNSSNGDMVCQDIEILLETAEEGTESFSVTAVFEERVSPASDFATVEIQGEALFIQGNTELYLAALSPPSSTQNAHPCLLAILPVWMEGVRQ